MKQQLQPNHWSCLPTAFASLLDVDVQEIFDFCGHDGSEKVFPEVYNFAKSLGDIVYFDALCRRSFHIQEMVDYCYNKQVAVIEIQNNLISTNGDRDFEIPHNPNRMGQYLKNNDGVLVGTINNRCHAVAWYKGQIYDPNGTIYELIKFTIDVFYLLKHI